MVSYARREPLIADSNRGGNVTVEGEPADLAEPGTFC